MTNTGITDLSERGRVWSVLLHTIAAIVITRVIIGLLHLDGVFGFIHRQSFAAGLILSMMLWGAVMLAMRHAPSAAGFTVGKGAHLAARIVRIALRGLIYALAFCLRGLISALAFSLRWLWRGARVLLPALAILLLGRISYEFIWLRVQERWQPVGSRLDQARVVLTKEWKLWRAYRAEFRTQFRSYRKFRASFAELGRKKQQETARAKADPFAAACRVLGLPEGRLFSENDLKARYHALMKTVHPDVAGPNDLAAQVNAAYALIKQRKGWS